MSLPHLEPTVSAARFSAALSCKPALPMAFYVVHSEMPSFTMPYPQSVQGDNPVWVSGNGKSSCQHFARPGNQTAKRSILPHSMYGGRMCTMNMSSGCSSPMHLSSVRAVPSASTYWRNEVLRDGSIRPQTAGREEQGVGYGCVSHPPVQ